MTYYPFDKQKCEIKVENWAYTGGQVSLHNKTDHVPTTNFVEQGIWDFVGSEVEHTNIYNDIYPGVPFPELVFTLLLQRKATYYMLNIVTPCVMIIIIALSVFWMPPDAGEKVSLGITVLLAFSVFQIIIADNTPKNSDYSPVLSMYTNEIKYLKQALVVSRALLPAHLLRFPFREYMTGSYLYPV